MTKLTVQDCEQIEMLHRQGDMTLTEIAARFQVANTTVTRVLARRGIIAHPVTLTKQLDALTLAYYAGIFDGEGHITIGASKRPQFHDRIDYWLQIGVVNTHRLLLETLQADFGVGHLSQLYGSGQGNRLPAWAWRCTSNQASQVLEMLLPYLRIKAEPAKLGIEFQAHMKERKRDKEWQLMIKQRITEWNSLS